MGRRAPVPGDKVVDGRWAANMKLGGRGYRYTVMVGGRERLLWRDENRWYVEMKVPDGGPALLSPRGYRARGRRCRVEVRFSLMKGVPSSRRQSAIATEAADGRMGVMRHRYGICSTK